MVYYQERETVRLLLNYADHALEDQKLGDFLMHELEDVKFTNVVFVEIYNSFQKMLREGKKIDSQYLMQHGSNEVKKIITDLITSRYEISPHWRDKHIYVPNESEVLPDMALTNVLRLKFRVVQKMMEANLLQIRNAEQAGSLEDVEKYLEQQNGLKNAERELASVLGIVVAR